MQNEQIYSEIIKLIKTRDDFNAMNKELQSIEETLYEPKVNVEFSPLILELLKSNSKEIILAEIKKRLSSIKFVNLTLSFAPSQDMIERISNWLGKSVPQNIALDIKIDPEIVGGAVIEFDGKYFDYSLKNKLDNILKNYV
jgi:F0F1-type ATP synthase delta subunit